MVIARPNGYSQSFSRVLSSDILGIEDTNGIAVVDIDNDNDLDVFIVARQDLKKTEDSRQSRLFRNDNGVFKDITAQSGIESSFNYEQVALAWDVGAKMGASWGDYDNDGYPDLFLTSLYHHELYHNNGDETFTDVTKITGIEADNPCYNSGATWWDYNNDGHLDLYITKWGQCASNTFYKNNGDGTFKDITEQLRMGGTYRNSWMSMPLDINEDGWIDLYISNDFDEPNELYINQNGESFVESAFEYGVNDGEKDGMGITLGDYNKDGNFDIYITNIRDNSLLENTGETLFIDKASELGVKNTGWAWGTQFADFNNNGNEDLVVVNGFQEEEPNFFYKNEVLNNEHVFTDITEEMGFNDSSLSNAVAVFDYNNDGYLDIIVTNSNKEMFFYENKSGTEDWDKKHWLKIALEGTTSNRDAIGSRIEISTAEGTQYRFYHGTNFLSQSLQPVHFGLGSDSVVSQIKITWPSGLTEEYENIPVNQSFLAVEGSGQPVTEMVLGCTDPKSCNYNPLATFSDGSCTYLDSKEIQGKKTPGNLAEEIYSYPLTENSQYFWTIKNGEILEGQGSSTIKVKWGIDTDGIVGVTESNVCSGLPVEFHVQMSADQLSSKHSIARLWNEVLLEAIRNDYARPTIHARNLFHTSIVMYDAWAIFDQSARPYLIGQQLNGYTNDFTEFQRKEGINIADARKEAISYAVYRLLTYRFKDSPNATKTLTHFDQIMGLLNYNKDMTSLDYTTGDPRALGNYIAESIKNYGHVDGAREIQKYENSYYWASNPAMEPAEAGNPTLIKPNRWQPLRLKTFIDQSGNQIRGVVPDFLSPEWGNVSPFSLSAKDVNLYTRNGNSYRVFHDPGTPPHLDSSNTDNYQWNFSLVSIWSSQLDPSDGVFWDISPKNIGNLNSADFPSHFDDYSSFYPLNGGDPSRGRSINPVTGNAYSPQKVPRGDYTRVLAEFWADGPDSETPPGHWFVLLNGVSDHPLFSKKIGGVGPALNPLEWDVKSYFILGGAMHDAAIAAWSIKGWYDYIRPISAIRYMADLGQSTDPTLVSYNPQGIPLLKGYIELVAQNDELAGMDEKNVGKIKLYAWKGHDHIKNPAKDKAGVGWILAENWWPYQRPSFVTPPFAGYVSGHSTFSRAAAEVMTSLTGSEYFPGGLGEFVAKKDEFLVFEQGPSQDITLQWATYRDASDQCSLSRIWGGIHPPADDLPGRLIGEKIGKDAFDLASSYFLNAVSGLPNLKSKMLVYPNPVHQTNEVRIDNTTPNQEFVLVDLHGRKVPVDISFDASVKSTRLRWKKLPRGMYLLQSEQQSFKVIIE